MKNIAFVDTMPLLALRDFNGIYYNSKKFRGFWLIKMRFNLFNKGLDFYTLIDYLSLNLFLLGQAWDLIIASSLSVLIKFYEILKNQLKMVKHGNLIGN